MTRSKKIFLIISGLFVLAVILFTIDIFSRTTFPGARKQQIERAKSNLDTTNRVHVDSTGQQ